jgi:hypothetical protein
MKKSLNNRQKLNKLVRELHAANPRIDIGLALLIERITKISEITRRDIENGSTAYDMPIIGIDSGMYLHLCNIIDETLNENN